MLIERFFKLYLFTAVLISVAIAFPTVTSAQYGCNVFVEQCDQVDDENGNCSLINMAGCDCGAGWSCGGGEICCQGNCVGAGQCGGGGGECRGTGVRSDCPSGTYRSDVVTGSQCARICAGLGTAQRAGECCDWVTTRGEPCDWNPCPTYNNPDKQCCTGGTDDETWCRNSTTYTYQCLPICTAPTAPSTTAPADGAQLADVNVNLLWNPSTFDESASCGGDYEVYVGTTNPPTTLYSTVDSSVTNDVFVGTRGTTYYWYVKAVTFNQSADSTPVSSFTVLDNVVAGTVYYDPNNVCSTSTPWNQGSGMTVSLRDTAYSDGVTNGGVGTGQFAVVAEIDQSYQYLDLAGVPANYVCSTAVGCNSCPTLTNVGPVPTAGNNFFLTDKREPWWQAVGGGIYVGGLGGGVTVRSEIPSANTPLIAPGVGGAIGALLRASGSADIGSGVISTPGYSTQSRYRGKTMGYDFFAAQMGVVPSQEDNWASSNLETKPAGEPQDFYYASGDAVITNLWDVLSDESFVVFVNGDLRIEANVTVAEGGYLVFIVNGDVVIDPSVTQIQGLYVIDGQFETESQYVQHTTDDLPLEVEGSVVAWGGVSLSRDTGLSNAVAPAESFSYRPDFLISMPDKMKVFALRWREVAPGTFGQ